MINQQVIADLELALDTPQVARHFFGLETNSNSL
jgi:hypothetical protein